MTDASWPDLVQFLDDARGALPAFPTNQLPATIAAYATSIAGQFLCPVDLPAALLLGTVSAASARRVRLRVTDDWFEPANLYLLVVLSPSLHKSPIFKLAIAPVEREERRLRERWELEEKQRAVGREVLKVEIGAMRRKGALEQGAHEKLAAAAELEARPCPRLIVDDATSEYLARALQEGALFMASAEGRPFELMSGLYRKVGEDGADVFLKAWSEDPIRVGRVTKGEVYVPHPNLTLCLAVQPTVVGKLACRDDFRGRGLIARFLCSYPRTCVGFRNWSKAAPVDPLARSNYEALVSALLSLQRQVGAELSPVVSMSVDAAAVFGTLRQDIENEQRRGGLLPEWQDLGGKLAGHTARIALVLHMAEHGRDGPSLELSESTMTNAIGVSRYFLNHTIATWGASVEDPPAARVARWLASESRAVVRTREIHRAHQRLFPKAQDARNAAIELAERGYLRRQADADVWGLSSHIRRGIELQLTAMTPTPRR